MRLLGLLIAYHAAVAALRTSRSLADGLVLRHARRALARELRAEAERALWDVLPPLAPPERRVDPLWDALVGTERWPAPRGQA